MKTFYISIKFIVAFYVNMLQQLHLPVNSINGKHEKYHLKFLNLSKLANNNVNSTFELKRKLDWCLELISVMWKWNTGIASSFLGDIHLICSYSRGYRIKQSEKDVVFFQPEENHKTRIAKSEKVLNITGSKTSWKLVFFLIFYAKQKRLKHQGKTVRQSVIPGNFKRRYWRSPHDSGVLFYWVAVLTCKHFNRPVMS